MSEEAKWEALNSRHLAAALKRLKQRLERLASGEKLKAQDAGPETPAAKSREDGLPAFLLLERALGLSPFERDLLLLCATAEFDSAFPSLFAKAQGDPGRTSPTFALALSLLDDPTWDALSPERPLRYFRLIEINQPGAQALTVSALRADERIVNYLKGLNYLDDRLAPFVAAVGSDQPAAEMPPSQGELGRQVTAPWRLASAAAPPPIVQLLGADSGAKQLIALDAAVRLKRQLYRMPADALPAQPAELEMLGRLWQRESLLLPVALWIDAQEIDASDAHAATIRRFLARCAGFVMLSVREPWPRLPRESSMVDIIKPTMDEQRAAWQCICGDGDTQGPTALASQFNLNIADIARIGAITKAEQGSGKAPLRDRLWDACRARVRPMLDALAHRIEPKATFDDIVLPAEQTGLLHQIAAQVNQRGKVYGEWGFGARANRGLGISALFAGDSGTGKTMAAEVIANELRLNLYRIDLSAVVSKYIGETEKNLRRLFDAAEDGGAILFFDEADALFGKRSEVKDSHDRYANIEINYLLQRMEAYRGLAILATNLRSSLDNAFTRRLRFIVNFPFPGVVERRGMWQKAFPPQTPVRTLDHDRLARLNLTGGSIHNAALNAAFLGAQANSPVTMPLALAAARAEFVKLDRPVNEADFRWLETKEATA
ncbi:ATP-binding protein [Bradyrhizobium hipponense]|uniref:ATP-binding protein n=1 Tax=Bradyrhizobium hipponense TaxID=2605638 RepID=A0A5S4YGJ8_9BRAD|nr:ATP-binding protein [Bradyrhizobium hipponense]TYO63530.1 ATP-binding protein [Bradyrhizobium hipponense]